LIAGRDMTIGLVVPFAADKLPIECPIGRLLARAPQLVH